MAEINLRSYDFQVCDGKLVFCDGKCDNCTVDEMIDLVEVVRCKDCFFWGNNHLFHTDIVCYGDCLNLQRMTDETFFCKWGKRREE